jgi:D-alanine-D-alanine ligase
MAQTAVDAVRGRIHTVAVLLGGTSGERPISFAGGINVAHVLEAAGLAVMRIDPAEDDWLAQLQQCAPDVVFIALHGQNGEDGTVQGLLDLLHIPYTHSGVLASALAMDKERSKVHYRAMGLAVPASVPVCRGEHVELNALIEVVGLPCVVKPVCDGSSLGVAIPKTIEALTVALEEAFAIAREVMVEEFIAGVEVTVPVIGNTRGQALPVIEIIPAAEFYDYDSKYLEGGSQHIIPARITATQTTLCQHAAVCAHEALGCRGVSRTDLIVSPDGIPYVIETNTIPGMTNTSLVPESAQKAGLEPSLFYQYLLALALEAQDGL